MEKKRGKEALRRFAGGNAPNNYDGRLGVPAMTPGAGDAYQDVADEQAGYTQGPRLVPKDPAAV